VKELLYKPRGLMLVTGPTGSGKTTTLASMLNIVNEDREEVHHHHHRRPD
jgi:twitching motility protein PilT